MERPGAPESAQERANSAQTATQQRPKSPQDRPRAPKSAPRAPQERLKSARRRPREPSGRHFDAAQLEQATFEDDASRDSVETHVCYDFRSIFASCEQARICEKPIKTLYFTRFCRCRLFFARVGLLTRRSIGKTLKSTLLSTPNRSKINQNRSSERFSSDLSRPSRSKTALRAILSRLGRSKRPVGATVEASWVELGSLGGPVEGQVGLVGALARNLYG